MALGLKTGVDMDLLIKAVATGSGSRASRAASCSRSEPAR